LKLFRFRGGVHPDSHKLATGAKPIEVLPLADTLYIPVQQHIGAPAEPVVQIGDKVLKGQLLAHHQGTISAPIHASSSGTVVNIAEHTAPHPSGLGVHTIFIKTDGADRSIDGLQTTNPFELESDEISARVAAAGIVGLGGATFPCAVKLNLGKQYPIYTLIINGGECEPYLTCDDRLMQERSDDVIDGIRIMLHALQAKQALIAIEDNKPAAIEIMKVTASLFNNVKVIVVPSRYPMGSEKQMVQTLTGLEIPANKLSADLGVIVHNVGTAYAVHRALRQGQPLVSRIVTVGGGAIHSPRNLEVPFGTPVSHLFHHCGGFIAKPARILMGGPMMGQLLPHTKVPIVKGSSGVIALTAKEVASKQPRPCIRCGNCINACPCGLLPLEIAARAKNGDLQGAVDYGLTDCIACGSCSYVCPSHIPLVQFFAYAKGELIARQRHQQKAEATRKLAEIRIQRLQQEEQAKKQAAAHRQAKREAAKAKTETSV